MGERGKPPDISKYVSTTETNENTDVLAQAMLELGKQPEMATENEMPVIMVTESPNITISAPQLTNSSSTLTGGMVINDMMQNRSNYQVTVTTSCFPSSTTTTSVTYSSSMTTNQYQNSNMQPIMTTSASSAPYNGLLNFQQNLGYPSPYIQQQQPHFFYPDTNLVQQQQLYRYPDPNYQQQQTSLRFPEPSLAPPHNNIDVPIARPPPQPLRGITPFQQSFSDALRKEVRTPGSGGRRAVIRQRQDEDDNTHEYKKSKTSKERNEEPPLMIEGNLTGYQSYEAINEEFAKYMPTHRIKRINLTMKGQIVVIGKTAEDRIHLLTHYPVKDIFKGQTKIREGKERVDYENSIVLQDIPLGCSNEEISRLLSSADIPAVGIQRMRNKDKQETTSVRIDLPTKEIQRNIKASGIKFDLISVRIKEYEAPTPRITQCYRCQGYNHMAMNCPNSLKCLRCSGPHRSSDCTTTNSKDFTCANCSGNHASVSPNCPTRNTEIENQRLRNNGSQQRNKIVASEMDNIKYSHSRNNDGASKGAGYSTPRHLRLYNQRQPNPTPTSNQQRNNLTTSLKEIVEKDQDALLGLILLTTLCVSKPPTKETVNSLSKELISISNICNIKLDETKVVSTLNKVAQLWIV